MEGKVCVKETRPRLRGNKTLSRELADQLRSRIMSGEFPQTTRLPSEAQVASEYGVSRVSVRTAMKMLESQGLVETRHGSGSFVCDFGGPIQAGLQELRSITETIRDMGLEPSMERHKVERRIASTAEAARLALNEGAEVISLERAVLADGQLVAYSFDTLAIGLLPPGAVEALGSGSVFATLRLFGLEPVRAVAEVHAVSSKDVGWGAERPESGLYLLLDQLHFGDRGERLMYSRTYFVEGRFRFVILRTL